MLIDCADLLKCDASVLNLLTNCKQFAILEKSSKKLKNFPNQKGIIYRTLFKMGNLCLFEKEIYIIEGRILMKAEKRYLFAFHCY